MSTDSLSDLPFFDMLNFLPDGVVFHQAIRDENRTIVDFRLVYYNETFVSFCPPPYKRDIGMCMIADNPGQEEILGPAMRQYKQVVETGQMATHIFYDPNLKATISLRARKMGDGVLVTLRDISAQQLVAQQVKDQNRLLEGVLNTSLNGTVVYEAIRDEHQKIVDFRFRLYNQTARKDILNRIGRDIAEHTLLSIYPDSHVTGMFSLYEHVTKSGESVRREHYYPDIKIWYDVSITKLDDGCVVTFLNITQLKESIQQATEQAEFVSKLLDGSLNGLVSLEPVRNPADGRLIDLRISSANRAAEVFFQRNQAELTGNNLIELYPESVDMGLLTMFDRVLITRQSERVEAYRQTDKAELWLDVSATPRDGEGLVVSFINISERKKAERQTDLLIQALQKTNSNLEQFAYVASHDLQEPLRKVMAFGDMLHNQYADALGETGADMINRMQSAAARMQILIKDLLAYSRVANTRELFGPVDLNHVVAEVINDLELVITDKQAAILVETLPIVKGDASQLRQLFQNLISNGLKFSRPDVIPQLYITADVVRGHEVNQLGPDGINRLPESLANWSFHRIQVVDNGIGFDPLYADQIFQLFQRLHSRSQFTGTGIGLSIVQKVVENHQGFISAEGRPNDGSTFVILLPSKTL